MKSPTMLILCATMALCVKAANVRVFLLCGQSNMEGHGVALKARGNGEGNGTLEYALDVNHDSLPVCCQCST